MTENMLERRHPRWMQIAVIVGFEILIFALIMALLLIDNVTIILIELAIFVGGVVLLKRLPAVKKMISSAFGQNQAVALVTIILLLLTVPFVLASSTYWLFILITAMLYLMAALGLNLQLGSTGMMNLAAAAFMAFGAYSAGLLALDLGIPPWLTLILGAIITGAFSILLFIPVMKTKGHYLALVSIAFQFMVVILVENMEWTGGPQGLKNIPLFSFLGYNFNQTVNLGFGQYHFYFNFYYLALALVILLIVIAHRIYHSWVGVTLATIRDDEVAAQTSGVQLNKWRLLIFVVGNCFIGLSGAFYSHMVGFISPPNFTFEKSLVLVSIVILGGMDNVFGIIAGSLLLVVLPEKLRVVSDYRFLIYGLVLVIMLIFQPKGLIPFQPRNYLGLLNRLKRKAPVVQPESEPAEKPL